MRLRAREEILRVTPRWLLLVSCVVGLHLAPLHAAAQVCGNGVVEADEDCDDGGICIGGSNAGSTCTSESQCNGGGVCEAGTRLGHGCAADTDCPGSRCVHCRTFGGDGCAANCTVETELVQTFTPGVVNGLTLEPGTAGAGIFADPYTIALPFYFAGGETIRVGRARADGSMPFSIAAISVLIPQIPVGSGACACVRAAALKTCGGLLFQSDGHPSGSCSTDFPGAIQCPTDLPCTFVHGLGNSAAGVIGCGADGLAETTISSAQDGGLLGEPPGATETRREGNGQPGSATAVETLAYGLKGGRCLESFCSDSDPVGDRGTPFSIFLTTGTASAEMRNANNAPLPIGPFGVTGAPASCAALQQRSQADDNSLGMAGATTFVDLPTIGDGVTTLQLFGPLAPVPPRPGDCNTDGQVTIEELLRAVNIALGVADRTTCPAADADRNGQVTVDEVIVAVNTALG